MSNGKQVVHTHRKDTCKLQTCIMNIEDPHIIRGILTMHRDPIDDTLHPNNTLLNIVTGVVHVAVPDVTADDALGQNQMTVFKNV